MSWLIGGPWLQALLPIVCRTKSKTVMIVIALIWVNKVITFGWRHDWDNSYFWSISWPELFLSNCKKYCRIFPAKNEVGFLWRRRKRWKEHDLLCFKPGNRNSLNYKRKTGKLTMTTICWLIRLDCCFREEDRWLVHTALTFVLFRNRPVCCLRTEKVLSGKVATS